MCRSHPVGAVELTNHKSRNPTLPVVTEPESGFVGLGNDLVNVEVRVV